MLIKPLAYKGPADHLTALFSEQLLFDGLKLLLRDSLHQWHHDPTTEWVSGQFKFDKLYIASEISWPLASDGYHCNCDQTNLCEHIAALAIETKRRLHQISYTLKDAVDEESLWQTTRQWLLRQSHDPFPNMARHRLVYLLKKEADGFHISFYKAYLTQEGRYQLKEKFEFHQLQFKKLPKFVSLTDQAIIHRCQQQLNDQSGSSKSLFYLQANNPAHAEIFQLMLDTQRCFWKASSRPPLKHQLISSIEADWDCIVEPHYFDIQHNRVATLRTEQTLAELDNQSLSPSLRVVTEQIDLPWRKQHPLMVDVGRVVFTTAEGTDYRYDQLLAQEATLTRQQKLDIACYVREIQSVETVYGEFEIPIAQQFDHADRALTQSVGQLVVWLAGLHHAGWRVKFSSSYRLKKQRADDWYLQLEDEQDWFEIELGITVDGRSINLMPYLVKAIANGQIDLKNINNKELTLQLDSGEHIVLESSRVNQIVLTLVELFDRKPLNANQRIKLPKSHLTRLAQFDSESLNFDWQGSDWLRQKIRNLTHSKPQVVELPKQLNATLRDYQQVGINWLHYLRQHQLGGILADDMGLGKTLQTLTHLLIAKNNRQLKHPVLIIAPTSLLFNWKNEAERFTPDLNALVFYGSERHQAFESLQHYDLIITSYGVVQRDINALKQVRFDTVILDEAQAIKNAKTKMAKSCFALQSDHRLCLTGTPMENHLGELWSLFHFLMPGFLGTEAQFNRVYRIPIEKDQEANRQSALSQRVAPFMLRRKKSEVAKELPPKTELERLLEMSQPQADLYEAVRLSMSEEIQKAIYQSGGGKNQLLISNALLRLRQICCHPKLVKLNASDSVDESAKMEWLESMIPEMVEEGRSILVFSSFTTMLDLIEESLSKLGIATLKLTGKTTHRGRLVEQFQAGKFPVFLISLKAGGSGLNLTQADTVIHVDPWWNPAAEDQASDRAYRIGQDKPVFVYKLITRGTVEERILKMQRKKQNLSDKIYANSLTQLDSISGQDWEALFQPIE